MNKYGMPYQGSKNKIADNIITALPTGKRLVDLFGGGGAITHAASLSNKWDVVVYNELNSLVVNLFKSAINGDYSYDKFKPKWISREEFMSEKNRCGYIKYIWSFGNTGTGYLFGKDIENYKRIMHNVAVFNDFSEMFEIYPDFKEFPNDCITITQRRLFMMSYVQQLQGLEQLQGLQKITKVEIFNKNYLEFEFMDGDIIYCDPPYADTAKYSRDGFNHDGFWEWVRNCPHCVIISEYSAPEDIQQFGHMEKLGLLKSGNASRKTMIEKLFWNGRGNLNAGNLFE